MILPTQRDVLAQKEYYQDQMRAAARHNRARRAMAGREEARFYARVCAHALGWLGRRMVAWGTNLQESYKTLASPVPQPH
jgi:hypothetical protein